MNNIGELIQKYLAGETSLSEEKTLRNYFSSGKVDEKWKKYQSLFGFFTEAQQEKMPSPEPKVVKMPKRMSWYRAVAVIALPLLCLAGYWSYQNYQEKKEIRIAYAQTQEAFELLGKNLNKGLNEMAYLKEFDKTKEKIINLEN